MNKIPEPRREIIRQGFEIFGVPASTPTTQGSWGRMGMAAVIGISPLNICVMTPLLNVAFHRPSPLSAKGLLTVYELSNFLWAALLIWHASRAKAGHVALFFGAGLLYGACLERFNGPAWSVLYEFGNHWWPLASGLLS